MLLASLVGAARAHSHCFFREDAGSRPRDSNPCQLRMGEIGVRLKGKKAVILGASSPDNMGQSIARRFIAEGAEVLVSGRKDDVLRAFAAETGCRWSACD